MTKESKILNEQNIGQESEKKVAFIPHKGLMYGMASAKIYEKTLYYSDDKDSCLNKYNILHLDYSNYPKPEKKMIWIMILKMNTLYYRIIVIFFFYAKVIIKSVM